MLVKEHYSLAGIWIPTSGETAKKLAGPAEVTFLKLSSGAGAAYVSVYDGSSGSDAIPANRKWVLDCSTTDNDVNPFHSPLHFAKGVYAVCEQGIGLDPVVCIAVSK